MKVTLLVLVGLLTVTSAHRWGNRGGNRHQRPSNFRWNPFLDFVEQRDECDCASTRITVDEKIERIGIDNDVNKNGIVKFDDIYTDVTERYDTNNDGSLTERECINRWRCAYGDTDQVAQFNCAMIMRGEPVAVISSFNSPPFVEGVPLDSFLNNARSRYERFFNDRCVNCDITLDKKLELNAAANDHNNDSVVTTEDILSDVSNNYDTDKDGNLTKAEWVVRWVCAFGDSGDYARYVWDQFTQGAPSVPNNFFDFPPYNTTGEPIDDFIARNRQNYENYRRQSLSNYIQFRA